MTTIKRSYSGQWADIHANTRLATEEADERQAIERADGMFQVLKWAIAVVAVFGCMSFAWWYA